MLPNIMNAMPMSPLMPGNTTPLGITPQSETVGFDFNTYLLGLQNLVTDGKVDWAQLLQADSRDLKNPAELLKDATGTEANTANPMGALAALFNLPTHVAQAEQPVAADFSAAVEPSVTAAKVDWNALGLTKVNSTEIQAQGWDMAKVEQLFATRKGDLEAAGDQSLQALGVKVKAELPTEKAVAFAAEPLTANQAVLTVPEKRTNSHVSNANEVSGILQTAPDVRQAAIAGERIDLADRFREQSREQSKTDGTLENSLFAAVNQTPSSSSNKVETFTVASPQATSVASAAPAAPEWVTRTESLAGQGGGKMTLALTPPELGKVEIEVVTRGKNVEVEIRSENDGARKALESGLNDLKSALLGQDLILSKSEVKVGAMERFNLDGFNQNQAQTFDNPYTSQDRQPSGNNSQGYSERSGRWETAQSKSVDVGRQAINRYASVNDGRLDVRI